MVVHTTTAWVAITVALVTFAVTIPAAFLLLLEVIEDLFDRPPTVLRLGLYAYLRHLDEPFTVIGIVQHAIDKEVSRHVSESCILLMQCLPHSQVTIGFVRCLMQYEEAKLGVGLHVLLDKGGVVPDVPSVRCRSRYVVVHDHLATSKHT